MFRENEIDGQTLSQIDENQFTDMFSDIIKREEAKEELDRLWAVIKAFNYAAIIESVSSTLIYV